MTEDRGSIALIGAGAMGEALAGGWIAAGTDAARIRAVDPDPGRRKHVRERLGVATCAEASEAVPGAGRVVLAVKPALVPRVLEALAPLSPAERLEPLWISIAAGVPLATLEAGLPRGARVVRAMPNTPALIRAGATAFAANRACTDPDRSAARETFEAVGVVWEAPSEDLLDAVTGLSGSGPAYVFVFLEALADAGVRVGLPRDAAQLLATQTVLGAARLAQESGVHVGALKDQVTSPGGTTIAGLARLEAHGLRAALYDAVEAATRRSRELAR